jgi:SAM-dependent methyltransferase
MVDPFTRRFFERAGIGAGMRVLDVGSGAGDVALLLTDLVGPSGSVTGVDRSAVALDTARRRAGERSLGNVSFVNGDLTRVTFDTPFDAIAGRYVLMFQPDAASLLRALSRHARPGTIVVFHEPDWDGARSRPACPLYDRCIRWIVEAIRGTGADEHMGAKLHAAFIDAGLPVPQMGLETQIGGAGGEGAEDAARLITDIVRTIAPELERLGVANAGDIGIDTLHERVMGEMIDRRAVVVGRSEIGAWCRLS